MQEATTSLAAAEDIKLRLGAITMVVFYQVWMAVLHPKKVQRVTLSHVIPVYVVGCDEAIGFAGRGPVNFQDLGSSCLYNRGRQVSRCSVQSPDIHTSTSSTPS